MTDETSAPAAPDADPSMEEILASIRRILNDDEAPALPEAAAATPASASAAAEAEEEEDVLLLDEAMLVTPSRPASDSEALEPVFEARRPEPLAPRVEPPRPEMEVTPSSLSAEAMGSDLLGPEAAAAAASSVSNLMRTLAAGRATQVYGGGPTLEQIVRAELRPLLKDWLDAYLPPMVERLVRAEIERVVGRCVP